MIHIHDVSYIYQSGERAIHALESISLELGENEFIALMGANGSGKSTLARLLNGLFIPSMGRVEVDGISTTDSSQLARIRQTVGLVFQNPDNQLIGSTVEEDIAFGPENLGLPPREIRERVDEALTLVEMLEHAKREPHMLSGGQKQRIALAGVLAMRPKYLVLDEATSMLDPASASEILETLHRLHREIAIGIILISHRPEEAIRAERVIVLHNGSVVLDQAPQTVFAASSDLHGYGIGLPRSEVIAQRLRERGVILEKPCLNLDELVDALC